MQFTKSDSRLSKDINELKIICDKIQAHFFRKERLSQKNKEDISFKEQFDFYSVIIPNLKKKIGDISGLNESQKHAKLQEVIDNWTKENGAKCREYLDYKKIPTLRKPLYSPTSPAGENINNSPTIFGGNLDSCVFLKAHFDRRFRIGEIKFNISEEVNFYSMIIPGLKDYASSKKFQELFISEKIEILKEKIQKWEDSVINQCPEYVPTLYNLSPRSSVATITRNPITRSSSMVTIVRGGGGTKVKSKTKKPKAKKTKSQVKK